MIAAPIHLAGETLLLDPAGALFWPAANLMAVADLHFEKGTACAAQGHLVPPWDTRLTLARLLGLMRRFRPATVVALGDSFHDRDASARLAMADVSALRRITGSTRMIWVLGNHDPVPPEGLGGEAIEEFRLGALIFRHEGHATAQTGEISGHCHPKARVVTRAGEIRRPCFVTDTRRVMLPAFGAYTGGLDVTHPAVAGLFPHGGQVFLLGRERLFNFALDPPVTARTTAAERYRSRG